MRFSTFRLAVLVAVSSLLACSFVTGQQSAAIAPKTPALPLWLEKLNLSSQQKQQVAAIISQHDATFAATWIQFGSSYQETLRIEASLLAAIEENLTETQRRQAHEHRRKLLSLPAAGKAAIPAASPAPDQASKAAESDASSHAVALTPEQEAAAKQIQEKFQTRLSSLATDIQLLHNRLLSIEMDKVVEIEKILSKEQRDQLSQLRQTVAVAVLDAAAQKSPPAAK